MRAFVFHRYGPPESLELVEMEKPVPGDKEILVRVHAASVNPLDYHTMVGRPVIGRVATGIPRPRHTRPGVDLAGVVEAVGEEITGFRPGDEVFGASRGTFADYVVTLGKALVHKPPILTFEQAAAVPVAATTALQGLRDKGGIQTGQKVLISSASGGVGTFAVQLALAYGAEVTAVCSPRNVEMVRSLGANRVIDYTRENYAREAQRYDLIFDSVGSHSLAANWRILNPDGAYVMAGGSIRRILLATLTARFVSQRQSFYLAATNNPDLLVLKELAEAGKLLSVIERTYSFAEVPAAIRYIGEGHARAKVVIAVAPTA